MFRQYSRGQAEHCRNAAWVHAGTHMLCTPEEVQRYLEQPNRYDHWVPVLGRPLDRVVAHVVCSRHVWWLAALQQERIGQRARSDACLWRSGAPLSQRRALIRAAPGSLRPGRLFQVYPIPLGHSVTLLCTHAWPGHVPPWRSCYGHSLTGVCAPGQGRCECFDCALRCAALHARGAGQALDERPR